MKFQNKEEYTKWLSLHDEHTYDHFFLVQHKYILELLEKIEQLEQSSYKNKACEDCKHMDTDVCNMCILLEYNQEVYKDLFERNNENVLS